MFGPTALLGAAEYGSVEIVQVLLGYSAIERNHSGHGHFPLLAAVRGRHTEVVEAFVTDLNVDMNPRGQGGYTPLNVTIAHGANDITKLLLSRPDTDVNVLDRLSTPLHLAAALSLGDLLV